MLVFFPVKDEVIKVGRTGVIVENFHTPKVFEPHSTPSIRSDDAPEVDSSRTPISWGVEIYTPDFHVFMPPRSASPTLGRPLVHIPGRGSITHGSSAPPLEPFRRAADLEASSSTRAA